MISQVSRALPPPRVSPGAGRLVCLVPPSSRRHTCDTPAFWGLTPHGAGLSEKRHPERRQRQVPPPPREAGLVPYILEVGGEFLV